MFMHKCEVFIQYVKDLEQKQQFLFFFTNCQYAAIFCLLLRYNFQFLLLLKFSLFCTHILTHNAYPSEIFLFLSLSDIHHGVATLFYDSKKKKKKSGRQDIRTSIFSYKYTSVTHQLFLTIPVKRYYIFIRFL